jgi:hypothetical protein
MLFIIYSSGSLFMIFLDSSVVFFSSGYAFGLAWEIFDSYEVTYYGVLLAIVIVFWTPVLIVLGVRV